MDEGARAVAYASLNDWLSALGQCWNSDRRKWKTMMWERLASANPVVNTTFVISDKGNPRESIPKSYEEFQAMLRDSDILITKL